MSRTSVFASQAARTRARLLNHPGHPDQKSHGRRGKGGDGVRDALAGAEDIGAVNSAAAAEARRITGRDIEFDLGGDPQIAREHAEGVLRGLERFPRAPLARVRQGADVYAEGEEAWASTSGNGRVITFTNDAQRYGADAYREDLAQSGQSGEIVGGTPMAVAIHEFGHSVANGYNANGWVDNAASTYAEIHMNNSSLREAAFSAVSRRAAENSHELAAEGFADVMVNGGSASGLSQAIMSQIEYEVSFQDSSADDG